MITATMMTTVYKPPNLPGTFLVRSPTLSGARLSFHFYIAHLGVDVSPRLQGVHLQQTTERLLKRRGVQEDHSPACAGCGESPHTAQGRPER